MKRILFLSLIFTFFAGVTQTYDLNITIKNIEKTEGYLKIAIYNDAENFLEKDNALKTYNVKVTKQTSTFTIKDLPKGEYAVAVYHDENSDKQCNRNFLGIPSEPYGFSKNFVPIFNKPSFEDCKIDLNDSTSIKIELL